MQGLAVFAVFFTDTCTSCERLWALGPQSPSSTEPITADWWLPDGLLPVCSGHTLTELMESCQMNNWNTSGSEGGICTFTVTPTFCPLCSVQTPVDLLWTCTPKRAENTEYLLFFFLQNYMLTPGQTHNRTLHGHTLVSWVVLPLVAKLFKAGSWLHLSHYGLLN